MDVFRKFISFGTRPLTLSEPPEQSRPCHLILGRLSYTVYPGSQPETKSMRNIFSMVFIVHPHFSGLSQLITRRGATPIGNDGKQPNDNNALLCGRGPHHHSSHCACHNDPAKCAEGSPKTFSLFTLVFVVQFFPRSICNVGPLEHHLVLR